MQSTGELSIMRLHSDWKGDHNTLARRVGERCQRHLGDKTVTVARLIAQMGDRCYNKDVMIAVLSGTMTVFMQDTATNKRWGPFELAAGANRPHCVFVPAGTAFRLVKMDGEGAFVFPCEDANDPHLPANRTFILGSEDDEPRMPVQRREGSSMAAAVH